MTILHTPAMLALLPLVSQKASQRARANKVLRRIAETFSMMAFLIPEELMKSREMGLGQE
jgi:hypothetical protein